MAGTPLVVAHRGASKDAPENTLPAFELAWDRGADAIEGDFYLTADGCIVCIHDKDTERVAGIKQTIKESSFEDLRKLDVGLWKAEEFSETRIPSVDEVLDTVPDGGKIYIEIKCGVEIVPKILDAVKQSGLKVEQVVFICFEQDVVS